MEFVESHVVERVNLPLIWVIGLLPLRIGFFGCLNGWGKAGEACIRPLWLVVFLTWVEESCPAHKFWEYVTSCWKRCCREDWVGSCSEKPLSVGLSYLHTLARAALLMSPRQCKTTPRNLSTQRTYNFFFVYSANYNNQSIINPQYQHWKLINLLKYKYILNTYPVVSATTKSSPHIRLSEMSKS